MGRHDQPSAGKTPAGKRGTKPVKGTVKIQSAGGAYLWKQIAATFGTKKRSK